MLKCESVCKSFGSLKAVNNISFKLKSGIIKGLIGPNGSGKTVLINTISGVPYHCDSGSILFNGRNIEKFKPADICKLGLARTFQMITFFPSLTVEKNLLVGSSSVGTDYKVVDEALRATELWKKRFIKASRLLSTFELKKLMLASCLSVNPKLIILDEPLAGLSEEEVIKTLKIINDINQTGITMLVIEHKIKELVGICHNMFVLHLGKVIAEGEPEEVINARDVLQAYFGGA